MEIKHKSATLKATEGKINVIFTKEIRDRDDELVLVKGINYKNFEDNPVVLDAHNRWSILDILANAKNIRPEIDNDKIAILTGDIVFADHPKAQYAETMVRKGQLNTISIGFRATDYDVESKTIITSELFEVSFVPIPSNTGAKVRNKQAEFYETCKAIDTLEDSEQVYKKLLWIEKNKTVLKSYRDVFMSKEICGLLNYEKTGNELIDLKNIYENLLSLFANQKASETQTLTKEELRNILFS